MIVSKKGVLMMSVMGNGIRSIKKQIFLSLGLFFSCSNLSAMCPQTVGPASITEGIWNVLLRVAAAQNVIQSQICAIDVVVTVTEVTVACNTSTAGCQCDCIQFGQSDIGAGGTYTISSPGVYCMYNDANFTTGAAITVNSSNVTIDMQEHTLNAGSNVGTTGIVINGGLSDVTIKNGNIHNPTVACISNGGPAVLLQNIIIQNMNFNVVGGTTSYPGVQITGGLSTEFNNVLVENCTGLNCFINLQPGLSAVVRGCQLSCTVNNGNASITIGGSSGTRMDIGVIEDCILKGLLTSAAVSNCLFTVQDATAAVINNCISYYSYTGGFQVNNVVNTSFSNCVAKNTNNGGPGFYCNGATPFTTELTLTNCLAQGCAGNGYWIYLGSGSGFGNVNMTNCVAQANSLNGVLVQNTLVGSAIPLTFKNCDSSQNGLHGFSIGQTSDPSGAIVGWGTITDCTATTNGEDGFFFFTDVIDLTVVGCTATNNLSAGYDIYGNNCYFESYALANGYYGFIDHTQLTPIPNYYFGNRSFNNTSGAFFPTGIPNQTSYGSAVNYGDNVFV